MLCTPPQSLTRHNVSQQGMGCLGGLEEGGRARHMCGHACSAPVGEPSRPSVPPCPPKHPHVAVLVTLRLTIVDICLIFNYF